MGAGPSQPSQNRAGAGAQPNIQSYSFKMLQRALDEGTQCWHAYTLIQTADLSSVGNTDVLSNVHNVHAPKVADHLIHDQGWLLDRKVV